MESCNFDFAAPQFLESLSDAATLAEQDGADSFFDTTDSKSFKLTKTPSCKEVPDTFYTPYEGDAIKENEQEINEETCQENQDGHCDIDDDKENKGSSMHDEKNMDKAQKPNKEDKHYFDGIELPVGTGKEKDHSMMTRQDKILKTPTLDLRKRSVVREALKRKRSPDEGETKKKYVSKFVSLAEEIMHFQVDTPPRFKSKLVSWEGKENKMLHLKPTVPQSPNLITKSRVRPVDNPGESEEKINNVFKAGKLNPKIFEKPDICERPKAKSPTIPKPFKLTELPKKEVPKEEAFQFKARPIPKWVKGSTENSATTPVSERKRRITVNSNEMMEDDNIYSGMSSLTKSNVSTQIKPFSFDERNKEMLKNKEEKIKKIQEEANKVPVFHAAPVPSYISNTTSSSLKPSLSMVSLISDTGSVRSVSSTNSEFRGENFKAKLPRVLYKEPFVPQKSTRPALETLNVVLNTEIRAKERNEFENELKMKEERVEKKKLEIMNYLEEREKKEIVELRKRLVHKPLPVPQYPDVHIDLRMDKK